MSRFPETLYQIAVLEFAFRDAHRLGGAIFERQIGLLPVEG